MPAPSDTMARSPSDSAAACISSSPPTASDLAAFITGHVLVVDGGSTA